MKVPILLPKIFNHPFTYETNLKLRLGDYVEVPFGKTKTVGVVWDEFEKNTEKKFETKKIIKKLKIPNLTKKMVNFINWFAEYNVIPKGMALKLSLLNNSNLEEFPKNELQNYSIHFKKKTFNLTKTQKDSLKKIEKKSNEFRVHVIQGVTGSGKTIVYFHAIKKILDRSRQCLILLPEIGLISQFEKKFTEFFGFYPAIWHSGISQKNRKIIWNGVVNNKIKIVIGARSSLFLPFSDLGLIIVDEEHDQSFKQDEGVIYNARDMAISRAFFENFPINLVTSIPSLETFNNIKKGKFSVSKISERFEKASLPNYEIINLNKTKLEPNSWLSKEIIEKVKYHLSINDQVLFFVNRRGFAPNVFCKKCLKIFTCPNCSINLVYHKTKEILLCHYCGHKSQINLECKDNKKCDLVFYGPGVERIAEEVKKKFPFQNQLIFSSDTMNKKNSKDILKKIVDNKIQILIGTQLISKGFHFPHLNCIVVVDIDLSSQGHDLRGTEKNLQLYHQLSGRAGRSGKPAIVYFQTYNLDKNMISDITNENPEIFLEKELELRKINGLPPFQRFISLIVTGSNEEKTEQEAKRFKIYIEKILDGKVLGPVNSPIFRIRKKFRVRLLIRSKKSLNIQKKLSTLISNFKFLNGIKLTVDVDPINFN
tara:strand:+ start:325 stop:2280 length:1956 start_codon:yes stop_codon:yes gene_type:complete